MKLLDPIYFQMFPTVARYIKKVQRERVLFWIGLAFSAFIMGRDLLRAYQEGVATAHMIELPARINNLEVACQRDYPKRSLVTKPQAQVITQQLEDARAKRP